MDVVAIPHEFFTRGWIQLLADAEIAAYLMWLDIDQNPQRHAPFVTGFERRDRYGLSRDAYESHELLRDLGLVSVEKDDRRAAGGTVIGYKEGEPALCHRVRIERNGLAADPKTQFDKALRLRLNDLRKRRAEADGA